MELGLVWNINAGEFDKKKEQKKKTSTPCPPVPPQTHTQPHTHPRLSCLLWRMEAFC